MPSSMIHLLCAKKFVPDSSALLCVGSLSPDCIFEREEKDRTHFRVSTNREKDLAEFGKSLNLGNDFELGTLLHLYTDMLWDEGPMESHKKAYTGSDWFHDYRNEINIATGYMFQHLPWARKVWAQMLEVPTESYSSIKEFPCDKINYFLNRNLKYQNEVREKPSEFFTMPLIEEFSDNVAARFDEWVKEL